MHLLALSGMNIIPHLPPDVAVVEQQRDEAVVICPRCGEKIGRVQTTPTEPSADEEEVAAEIRLIADEHRPMCPASQ